MGRGEEGQRDVGLGTLSPPQSRRVNEVNPQNIGQTKITSTTNYAGNGDPSISMKIYAYKFDLRV